ncbi:MAG: HD domain-containing protein [Candidatus Campbellbacteria bacterium]|nr:HD domain-containing protein [Candidatus Campbellbacteria bacterium]
MSKYTNDEDVLVAGILHDVIEDTEYNLEELENDFGENVSRMVYGVTEPKFDNAGNKLSWKTRKQAYLENLKEDSEGSMLICVADKICNLRSLAKDHSVYDEDLWEMLTASYEYKMWYHKQVVEILENRISNKVALYDLKHTLDNTKVEIEGQENSEKYYGFNRYPRFVVNALNSLRLSDLFARILRYGKRNTTN